MKKSLIALAALAAAGAASAQSSVTLYGRIDANLTYQEPGNDVGVVSPGVARGEAVYKMNDGGVNGVGGSRWGLRGSEDLGGGLRAYFVLESGYNVDNGGFGDSSRTFNRQAYVALGSKTLGDLRLGRHETLTRELNVGFADVTGESELSITENFATGANPGFPTATRARPLFQNLGTRVDNAVVYKTPNWGGFQVSGLLAAGEGVTARQQGLSASYRGGPFAVGLSYEQYDGFGQTYNDVITVGGNWNFGFATIYGAYQQTSDFGVATAAPVLGTDHDAYSVGLLVPFGSFQFRGQYTASSVDYAAAAGGGSSDQEKFGLSVRYALSKRTSLYAVATQRGGDNHGLLQRRREYAFGAGHNF